MGEPKITDTCVICEGTPDVDLGGAWYCTNCRLTIALSEARERVKELEGDVECLQDSHHCKVICDRDEEHKRVTAERDEARGIIERVRGWRAEWLEGIEETEVESDAGWWKTSVGAEYGGRVVAALDRILDGGTGEPDCVVKDEGGV